MPPHKSLNSSVFCQSQLGIQLRSSSIPVFGTLLSVFLIGETLHPFHIVALLLVLGGIAVAEWGRPKKA